MSWILGLVSFFGNVFSARGDGASLAKKGVQNPFLRRVLTSLVDRVALFGRVVETKGSKATTAAAPSFTHSKAAWSWR